MRRLIRTLVIITIGIFLIPALFAFAMAAGATVMAFISNPKVMTVILAILGIVSIPGILISFAAFKR